MDYTEFFGPIPFVTTDLQARILTILETGIVEENVIIDHSYDDNPDDYDIDSDIRTSRLERIGRAIDDNARSVEVERLSRPASVPVESSSTESTAPELAPAAGGTNEASNAS